MPRASRDKKIFVGFASAGAAGIWSYTRVLRKRGFSVDFYGIGHSKFGMPVDFALEFSTNKLVFAFQKLAFFFRILFKYNIWHLNCMEAFFFYPLDLLILKIFGKKIVLTFRGSDVRTNLDFLPINLQGKSSEWPAYYEKMRRFSKSFGSFKRRLRMRVFVNLADKVALTGPFLASSVSKFDQIIPYARDLKKILAIKTETHKSKVVIFHSPTATAVKGSEYILTAVRNLKKKYRNLEFRMPLNLKNEDLLSEMAKADIVIDQLLVGWYGGQAVEAMALGKPVICYIHQPYYQLVPFAKEIPVINSNIWTLEKDLSILIENQVLREKLGKEGIAFVKKYHAPNKVADEYLKLYFQE